MTDKGIRQCLLSLSICIFCAFAQAKENNPSLKPGRHAGDGIIVGFEYAVTNNEPLVKSMAEAYAEAGLTGMKHYPDAVSWGETQKGPRKKINFTELDRFVRHYQRQGFTELTLCLKTHSRWGSKDIGVLKHKNASPKRKYEGHFAKWVGAIVERYDHDGKQDMPDLRWPVRYYEIGCEFSSYQPEPVEDYLRTLSIAYKAAHDAFDDVVIAHAAFLTTPVNMKVDRPSQYDVVWRDTKRHDQHHDLADMRKVLDHPEHFDVINVHNLGYPYEIEDLFTWLNYETRKRGYRKDIIISDTLATSYIGWGVATKCEGKHLGLIGLPATEADRCELAEYFKKLTADDAATLDWTRGFVAADHVQRTIVAAEQGARLINIAFVADIYFLKWKLLRGGAGISAWGGGLDITPRGKIKQRFPLYYAMQQLMSHIQGYESIKRLDYKNDRVRLYEIRRAGATHLIAWQDPKQVLLPTSQLSPLTVHLAIDAESLLVEKVITGMGQSEADTDRIKPANGVFDVELLHTPVYIRPQK